MQRALEIFASLLQQPESIATYQTSKKSGGKCKGANENYCAALEELSIIAKKRRGEWE
jgi:hypothetical protein